VDRKGWFYKAKKSRATKVPKVLALWEIADKTKSGDIFE